MHLRAAECGPVMALWLMVVTKVWYKMPRPGDIMDPGLLFAFGFRRWSTLGAAKKQGESKKSKNLKKMCFCRQRKIFYKIEANPSRLTAMTVTITVNSSLRWWRSPRVVRRAPEGWKGSLRRAVSFCTDQKTGFLRGWDLSRSPQTGVAAPRLEPGLWRSDPCILTPCQTPSTLAPRILRLTLASSSCYPADHWGRFRRGWVLGGSNQPKVTQPAWTEMTQAA